jgi:hypothetical protein
VVANRLSLLRRADVILVLEKGRLARVGTHEELVHVPGIYRETALLQLMDLSEPSAGPRVQAAPLKPVAMGQGAGKTHCPTLA